MAWCGLARAGRKRRKEVLRSVRRLVTFVLKACDGTLGSVADAYVGQEHWAVRYLGLEGADSPILVSPIGIQSVLWDERLIVVFCGASRSAL